MILSLLMLLPLFPPVPYDYPNVNVAAITVNERSAFLRQIIDEPECEKVVPQAIDAGWEHELIPDLLKIVWRESRCLPGTCGKTDRPDLRRCRDWGLLQINDYSWKSVVESKNLTMEQMLDPYYNLVFGRWLYGYALEVFGDGWQPWQMPDEQSGSSDDSGSVVIEQ